MRKRVLLITAGTVLALDLQCIRPSISVHPPTAELQVPLEVSTILKKDCYSCHSDERWLAWFDEIVPAYWLVHSDILTAKQHLDFSTLGAKSPTMQKAALFEA